MFAPGLKRASAAGLTRLGAGNGLAAAGFTVSVAVRDTLLSAAVIVTEVAVLTTGVVTVKFAVVAPAATVTFAGTEAEVELLLNVTAAPPAGAGVVRVTVPCELFPPVTLVGFSVSEDKEAGGGGGVTVIVAVRVMPLKVAEMVALFVVVTATVLMLKVVLVAPAATVNLPGGGARRGG